MASAQEAGSASGTVIEVDVLHERVDTPRERTTRMETATTAHVLFRRKGVVFDDVRPECTGSVP